MLIKSYKSVCPGLHGPYGQRTYFPMRTSYYPLELQPGTWFSLPFAQILRDYRLSHRLYVCFEESCDGFLC